MSENATTVSAAAGPPSAPKASAPKASLRELAIFFLRLGTTAFGGPAAHIAIMEDELVRRRGWLSREKFLDLLGASSLIPGPSSSELAIHIGYQRAGLPGLLVAGTCFILPAFAMVSAFAWAYVRFGHLPAISALLYGVKPVVIAVILQALWGLGRTAVKSKLLAAVGLAATALAFYGLHPLLLLLLAGIAMALTKIDFHRAGITALAPAARFTELLRTPRALLAVAAAGASSVTLGSLFLVFLKIGSVVFGSGYVLLAFLRTDLVLHRAWLTDSQLLDAVAVGQVTPGPVFTTATFIGYLLARMPGAAVATIGIFLPAFILVAISGPIVFGIRRSKIAGAFLDGVIVASLALMLVVSWQLARASVIDLKTAVLATISLFLLLRFRVNSAWLVLGGAIIGILSRGL
ncbi:MAG TPA: chromate efflux transporter [Candidatus Acidoferrales bacterium]|nr:chromate efflux transporter [Candidatus Acidoferrales bacterium]